VIVTVSLRIAIPIDDSKKKDIKKRLVKMIVGDEINNEEEEDKILWSFLEEIIRLLEEHRVITLDTRLFPS